MISPRVTGCAYPIGKAWTWEIWIFMGPGDPEPVHLLSDEVCISKDAAVLKMRANIARAMQFVAASLGVPEPGWVVGADGAVQTIDGFVWSDR